ncbi:VOC family protein [Pollutimonas bauzanensis]|nr:VOC family protein [Pollutimonas bauzanensis]
MRTAIEIGTDMSESTAKLRPFSFVLAVPDLERSASYFRDALGFRLEWPEGSGWQLVSRGDVRIMIGHCPEAMLPSVTGDHSYFGYLNVDDADALHSELVNRGAIILQPPTDRPHGMREFVIGTPDGHRMMVGQEWPAAN